MVTGSKRLGPLSDYTANCRPVRSSDSAPQKQDHKFQTATFRQEVIFGRKSHKGQSTTVSRKITSISEFGILYNLGALCKLLLYFFQICREIFPNFNLSVNQLGETFQTAEIKLLDENIDTAPLFTSAVAAYMYRRLFVPRLHLLRPKYSNIFVME
jgi:hypothetical protein